MIRAILATLFLTLAAPASAQSFSCRIDTNPACLDYGDTICSSLGKCVDNNAICFDRYQCDYEGFTCKSNLTDCADEYEDLLRKHNDLVREYNDLLENAERVQARASDADFCVELARTLEDAKSCY